MGDEMDPCECLWNHELAMRRLISLLRQGQSYCTDSECLDELPGVAGPAGLPAPASAGDGFLLVFLTMALAVAMYALRPRSRARALAEDVKPPRNAHDRDDGAPPTPPRI